MHNLNAPAMMKVAGLELFGSIDDILFVRDHCASPTGEWQDSALLKTLLSKLCPDLGKVYFDRQKWTEFIATPGSVVRLARVLVLLMISVLQEGAAVAQLVPRFPLFIGDMFVGENAEEWKKLQVKYDCEKRDRATMIHTHITWYHPLPSHLPSPLLFPFLNADLYFSRYVS